jgi:hypothetical protein
MGDNEQVIGVIFYQRALSPDDVFGGTDDNLQRFPELPSLSGIRVGTLRVLEPHLPSDENRIERQRSVFIAGYRPRDLQAVSIDRLYFRQYYGRTFEHKRNGISRNELLPGETPIAKLAKAVKTRKMSVITSNPIMNQARLDESSIIGSADAHLFWHLRFGREFLAKLSTIAEMEVASAAGLREIISAYYAKARVEADTGAIPHEGAKTSITPIASAVAALEAWAQLDQRAIWTHVQKHLPSGFQNGGIVSIEPPSVWSRSAAIALSCATFLVAWEHLRSVSGSRARELVQTAEFLLESSSSTSAKG